MKWGNKHEKGCSSSTCEYVHPFLCPKSLDLKCVDQTCPYKLHTLNCRRREIEHRSGDNIRGGPGFHGKSSEYGPREEYTPLSRGRSRWPGGHQSRPVWLSGYQGSTGWGGSQQKQVIWANNHEIPHNVQSNYGNFHQDHAGIVGEHHGHVAGGFGDRQGQPEVGWGPGGGQQGSAQSGWGRGLHGQAVQWVGGGQPDRPASQQDFRGMTVQQLLEAHTMSLVKQREELRLIQLKMNQHQLPYPAVESWGGVINPSY